jgi:phosphonate transport system substrate-binding protein
MLRVLIVMSLDPAGRVLLKRMNLDGFVAGNEALYDRVTQMMQVLGAQ